MTRPVLALAGRRIDAADAAVGRFPRVLERGVTHRPRAAGRSTVRPWHVPRTLASPARLWRHLRRNDDRLAGRDPGARWRAAMRRPAVALLPAVLGGLATLLVATPDRCYPGPDADSIA